MIGSSASAAYGAAPQPPSLIMQEQGETVIGGKLQPKRLVAGEAAHLRAFVQDEPFEFASAEGYFIIAAKIRAKARGSQIEIEPSEKLRLPGIEIELDLFAQFAAQRVRPRPRRRRRRRRTGPNGPGTRYQECRPAIAGGSGRLP